MDEINKDVLENEINLIRNQEIREWTKSTVQNCPKYFFTGMASSTGKYHPTCTCIEGGLVIHVKRAVYLADRLCGGYGIKGEDKDIVISATILHDIAKVGRGSGSFEDYENHPINAKNYFADFDDEKVIEEIDSCIRHHMGLWTPESIRKPLSEYTLKQLAVYTADYMATTKTLITPKDNIKKEITDGHNTPTTTKNIE